MIFGHEDMTDAYDGEEVLVFARCWVSSRMSEARAAAPEYTSNSAATSPPCRSLMLASQRTRSQGVGRVLTAV